MGQAYTPPGLKPFAPYQPPGLKPFNPEPAQSVDQQSEQPEETTRKVREASWPEWFISQGLRIAPPIGAAVLASETGPLGMAAAGAGASGLGETAAEAFEKWRGIREDINPWQIGVQSVAGAIPMGGKFPGVGATAEEFGKYALRAPLRGAAEGALLNATMSVPSALAEGDTPTIGNALHQAAGGAAFGLAGGALFGSIPAMRQAGRLREIANVPPPHPLTNEFNQRIPLDPIKPGTAESPILPFFPEQTPEAPTHVPVSEADTAAVSSSLPRIISVQDLNPLRATELRQKGYEVWEGHFNKNGDQQMIRRDLLPPDSKVAPLPDPNEEFSLTGQSMDDLGREADIRDQTVDRAKEIQREQQIPFEEAHAQAISEAKQRQFIEQVTPEMGPPARPAPPPPPTEPPAASGVNPGAAALVQRVSARVQQIMQQQGISAEEARGIAAKEYAQSVIAKQQAGSQTGGSQIPVDAQGMHEQQQPSAANNAMLRAQGFEPVGRVSPAGRPLWAKTSSTSRPTAPPVENQSPSMGDTQPYHPNDNFVVPESKVNKTLINNMAEDGMHPTGKDDKGNVIFTRTEPRPDLPQESRIPNSSKYQDLTPGDYKRYEVITEDNGLIHETTNYDEAHRIADEENGYVNDKGEQPQRTGRPHPLDDASGHGSVSATADAMIERARRAKPGADPIDYAGVDAHMNMMSHPLNSRFHQYWEAVGQEIMSRRNLPQESRKPDYRVGQSGPPRPTFPNAVRQASEQELYDLRTQLAGDVDHWVSKLADPEERFVAGQNRRRVADAKKRLAAIDREINTRRGGETVIPDEHPIVRKFRNGLEATHDPNKAYFILPDGTMLASPKYGGLHREIAGELGVKLDEAMDAGIIRWRKDGAEINTPITPEQAETLRYALDSSREKSLYLDVRKSDGALSPKEFNEGTTADKIRNWVNSHFDQDTVQRMRVTGVKEGNTGLENVAVGGADERVLDVLGNSLYSKPRPIVAIKELLQNAFDEHKISGVKEPVRVYIENAADNPINPSGDKGQALTVRDRGRGLKPDEIYTVLTDVGKTGKGNEESAAGGFGMAKASPFLGGKYSKVTSVVDTPKGRMRYTMEGTPAQLKKAAQGVALNAEKVGKDIPTGLEFYVWYPSDQSGFWQVSSWAKNMTERSPSVEGGIKLFDSYHSNKAEVRRWLDESPSNPITASEYNFPKSQAQEHVSQAMPTIQDTLVTPGANVNIHYDIEPGVEASQADIHMANKGMYQGTNELSYGEQTANVPRSIVADIIATVEEGHEDYPFSANREQISNDVSRAINTWVKENIITGVTKRRVEAIQKQYDAIDYLHPNGETGVQFLDADNKLTPDELDMIRNHPVLTKGISALEKVHKELLSIADKMGWSPVSYSATWQNPSERLKKFGLLFSGPDARGTTMGIHIPRPDDMNNSAILINLMEHLNNAARSDAPIDQLKTDLFTTLAHEQAHIPGGPHDTDFSYRDAQLRGKLGAGNTIALLNAIGKEFDDGRGNLSPELSEVLRIYNESRGRASGDPNAVVATGIAEQRPPSGAAGEGEIPSGSGTGKDKPRSIIREALNFPRAATTPLDLSASMRQGLPLITRKEWWTSWKQQLRALGSEKAYQKTLSDIKERPLFQPRRDMNPNSATYGKTTKSYAEQAGMKLSDVSHLNTREESVASTWIESGEMFGKDNPVQATYKAVLGNPIRASNRAYTAFLNQLRADTFESLIKDASREFKAGVKGSRDPMADLPFAKEIADFVNTATGKGPMRIARPTIEGGKLGLKESNLEQNAQLLTDTLFAPRLFFSRARMLNPMTYMMATPFVRKQYLKSALSVAGAWATVSGLGYMAGKAGLADVDVSLDPNSADFGKMRIGNTRMDPAGGFQQYLVALSRLISGRTTSSATGRDTELGAGFQADTRKDIAERFMVNKLNPVVKFAWDLMDASQYQPFHVADRTAQLFVPLIIQDVVELSKEDPSLLPLVAPIALGMGSQTYDKGETTGKLIPTENDWILQGGDPREMTSEDILPDWASEIQ